MTRSMLVESLPREVTGVDTVCGYRSLADLRNDTQFAQADEPPRDLGPVAAAIAWNFAVPPQLQSEPASLDAELEVLAAAIGVSERGAYRRNRRAYWRWVRDFTSGTVTGQAAIDDAVEELQDLVAEQHELVREAWIDRAVRTGFLAGTVTVGMLAAPLTPVALAGAALAVGGFTWTELRNRRRSGQGPESKVTAMFCQIDADIRRRLFKTSG